MIRPLDSLADGASYDIVVVGAGGAGMAAALFAAIEGRRVLLIERTGHLGGTTALSAGTTWAPNSHHAKGAGDSFDRADRFLTGVVGNHSRLDLRRAFLHSAPKAVAAIEAQSEVRFRPYALHPDYEQQVEGATLTGRALEPLPFDGRKLGGALALVRPPIPEFTLFGGMMVDRTDIGHLLKMTRSAASFAHAGRILGRYALDRLGGRRGSRLVMGNALIGRLLFSLLERDVDILIETSVTALGRDGDAVKGLTLTAKGATRRIGARHAVIMATGGFNRHRTRRAEMLHTPTPDFCPGAPGHTGDMQDLALGLGARFGEGNLDNAFWAPVSTRKRADGSTAVFPHFVMDRSKPGTVAVDSRGRRFVNETVSYHLFARAMFDAHREASAIPAFLIADARALKAYGLGMVRPGGRGLKAFLADGYLTEAPSIAALAARLGLDAGTLGETITAMNRFAETGIDSQFGRGSTAYQRVNGDATHQPNPTLGPIATPPFYAVRLYPGDIGAANGLVTGTEAQVLDGDNRPIAGLYACGNDMQSIMGGTYPGPGITLGPGLTFAYRAVRHALHGEAD
jgi:succinate dehydrogenase/fumarate reductase flavoprotein subunit